MYWKSLFNLKNFSVPATSSLTRDKSEDFQFPTTPFLFTINSIKALHIPSYVSDDILYSPDYEFFFEYRASLFDTNTSTFFGQTWKNIDSRFSTNLNINKLNYKDNRRRSRDNRRKNKSSEDHHSNENHPLDDDKSHSDYSSNRSRSSSRSSRGSESYSSSYSGSESDYSSDYDSNYSSSRSSFSNDSDRMNSDDTEHALIKDRSFNIIDKKVIKSY